MRERVDRRLVICSTPCARPRRRSRDDPDNLADQPFGQGEDRARDRLVRKARRSGERQSRLETVEKGEIVFAITPARHGRQREAARHLVGQIDVVVDGGFADQRRRNVVLAPETPQRGEDRLDVAPAAAQTIMELVEDEDPGAQAPQDLIELRGLGRRIARFGLRRLEGREDGVVEIEQPSALAGLDDPNLLGFAFGARRLQIRQREAFGDHALAVGVGAEQHQTGGAMDGGRTRRSSSIACAALAGGVPIQRAERI